MNRSSISSNSFCIWFKICSNARNNKRLRNLHCYILRTMTSPETFLLNNLIVTYGQVGNVKYACSVFDEMPHKNQFSWNSILSVCSKCGNLSKMEKIFSIMPEKDGVSWNCLISGYAIHNSALEAVEAYKMMVRNEFRNVTRVTFSTMLSLASSKRDTDLGRQVHGQVLKTGFDDQILVGSPLADMYAKIGMFNEAEKVFNELPQKNVVLYNTMIAGLMRCGMVDDSKRLFLEMDHRNSITWTTMITGLTQNGLEKEAIKLFTEMRLQRWEMDQFTYASILTACGRLAVLQEGKQIHALIIRTHNNYDVFVGSSLADMYCKCNFVKYAKRAFDNINEKNVISWTTLLVGYGKNGFYEEAIRIFGDMEQNGIKADDFSMGSVISSCANLATLEEGHQFHGRAIVSSLVSFITVSNALITLYGKCGCLHEAYQLFDEMHCKDEVSWTALVSCHAQFGNASDAILLFDRMISYNLKPDSVTFIAVISACSRAGLVDRGVQYFESMMKEHNVTPSAEHYTCMIDLYSRAGMLEKAKNFICTMPCQPDTIGWVTLLSSCRLKGNVDIGKWAGESLLKIDPHNPAVYVLLSSMYASKGSWNDVAKLRIEMKQNGVKKEPGYSWIKYKGKVYVFSADDQTNPFYQQIYAKLDDIMKEIIKAGYVPDPNWVLHDIEESEKMKILSSHSERLAIAFGLVFIPPGIPIRVVKNLRVCGDCHNATKYISKITQREILVRDASRYHLFKDGTCSCGDFW